MIFQKTELSNGLRVLTVPMPSLESATALIMVGAGSRYETKENNGISHFLEHMAFKGTQKRPTAKDVAEVIDGIGGEFNAFTSKEVTAFYVKSAASHLDTSLDVISDILINSAFSQEEIDKERGVIIQEINMYEDTPMRKIGDIYENLVYGDTPLGWDIAGEKDVIRKIQRQDFIDYIAKLYSPSNMSLIIAGGINQEEALEQAERYFGGMKKFETMEAKQLVVEQDKPNFKLRNKKTEQVHLILGLRTTRVCSADRYPLSVVASILGGGMSSRLFNEVREKRGLAYYVRAASQHYTDNGNLFCMAGVDAQKTEEAIKVILGEFAKIRDEAKDISEKELLKAKEYIKGHLVLELEDSRDVAVFYGEQELLEDEIENPARVLRKVDKVTIDDIRRVCEKYFKQNRLSLALIGDFNNGQKFQDLLNL